MNNVRGMQMSLFSFYRWEDFRTEAPLKISYLPHGFKDGTSLHYTDMSTHSNFQTSLFPFIIYREASRVVSNSSLKSHTSPGSGTIGPVRSSCVWQMNWTLGTSGVNDTLRIRRPNAWARNTRLVKCLSYGSHTPLGLLSVRYSSISFPWFLAQFKGRPGIHFNKCWLSGNEIKTDSYVQ